MVNEQNATYKIVKISGLTHTTDRYFVYRKVLFFWKHINSRWTQKEAEEVIAHDKRKRKPEIVGYY